MSIFKDTFRDYVRNQLELREELISIGNPDKFNQHEGNTNRRHLPHTFNSKRNGSITLKPGAHHTYTLNKQCVIRMTSLVDYVDDVNIEIGGLEGDQSFNKLKGASLSQNFILQGGILSDYARTFQKTDDNGNPITERRVRRVDQVRASFRKPGLKTNIAYGDFAIGADASEDGYGIVPMPGIIDATVRTKSAYGSLRECKINFEVHNQRQLEIMEMLYMRPGYMVLLEWGWCPYIASSNGIGNKGDIINNLRLVENETDYDIYTNNITQDRVYNAINNLKESQDGNYDGVLGFVKNFGFQAREDGGYSCFTELTSMGEVIESLKIPPVSIINTTKDINPSGNPTTDEGGDIFVRGGTVEQITEETKDWMINSPRTVTREKFDKAIATQIFPQYNGLLGLINVLNNYTIFGVGNYATENSKDTIDKIFNYKDTSEDGLSKAEIKSLSAKKTALTKQSGETVEYGNLNNSSLAMDFIRNLVTFQSADFESLLLKKFKLESKEELKNYIIPTTSTGMVATGTHVSKKSGTSTTTYSYLEGIDQAYIRWDALASLINDYLIPRNEKGTIPLKITTDRIYSFTKDASKLDPLLFCPIVSYENSEGDNTLLDFSCDSNVCILPLQFDQNLAEEASEDADPLHISQTLGYIPDLSIIPINLIVSMYGYGEQNTSNKVIGYHNQTIFNEDGSSIKLNNTDTLRRIGSIFLNINMLLNIAEKNADNEDYSVGMFIKDIFKEVNKVCPNHNFVLTDDKESNNIFIIDLPVDNSELPMDLHIFEPFSNKNILRNFDYTSNVPSAMSATIAIQAQDPRSIQDIDGVTFAAFNKSIKNRILSNDTDSTWEKTKNDIKAEGSKILSQQNILKNQLIAYRSSFFDNIKNIDNDKSILGEGNIIGILKTYQKNTAYLSTTQDRGSTFNSVIPLEFSATLDGISGMVIGNIFKIQKDRLPKAYHKSNIGFILFNEEQKITAGGDWTTDISGKMTILPTKSIKIKGTAVTLPQGNVISADIETKEGGAFVEGSESDTDITQEAITDINKAIVGSPLYLKYIKDPSLVSIDGEDLDGATHGYTTLRGNTDKGGPGINNEGGFFNQDDNSYGMFDSYNNPGMYLGTVKASTEFNSHPNYETSTGRWYEKYEENTLRILSEHAHKYFKGISAEGDQSLGYIFEYKEEETPASHGREDDPYTYYIPKEDYILINEERYEFNDEAMEKGILGGNGAPLHEGGHVTENIFTWFSVEFDRSVDDKFLKSWVRNRNNIDIDGADLSIFMVNKTLSEYTKGTTDVWMRSDTLAASSGSAMQMYIPDAPDPVTLPPPTTVIYTYRANTDVNGVFVIVENNIGLPSFQKNYSSVNYTQDTATDDVKFTMDSFGDYINNISYPKTNSTYP